MDPNWSKLVQEGLNGSKWDNYVLIGPNGFKWVRRGPNWSKLVNIGPNRSKCNNGSIWSNMGGEKNYHEVNQMAFKPRSHLGLVTLKSCFNDNVLTCWYLNLVSKKTKIVVVVKYMIWRDRQYIFFEGKTNFSLHIFFNAL